MLTGSPSFTSAPVSSSCHQGERSGAVVRFSSFHLIVIADRRRLVRGVPMTTVFVPRKSLSAAPEMPRSAEPRTMPISAQAR